MDKYIELDSMREDIVHRATYLRYTPQTMIQDMIAYTTRLHEVLLSEGVDCTYTPCYDEYGQYIEFGGSLSAIAIYLFSSYSPSFSPDPSPHTEFHTVGELLDNLHAAEGRYKEALHRVALEEALRKQCITCYYGAEGIYCGAGVDRVPGCLEHTTKSYE